VSVGGVVMIVGMFAPWVRSGAASRSSFEMLDLIERLGFARGGPVGIVVQAWPLAPLLVVCAVVSTWWLDGWFGGRIAAVVAIVVGFVVGGVGVVVRTAPQSALIGVRWGTLVTAAGGAMLVLGGVARLVAGPTRERSPVPETATLEDLA
jgi:hypothetical protein